MIIDKHNNLFIVKLFKENIDNFDIFDIENVTSLFKEIILKINKLYDIEGLCNINVYVNELYGMIIEIDNVYKYGGELDIKLNFHIDCIFLCEIDVNSMDVFEDVYYYDNRFYAIYNCLNDNNIIYKNNDIILENGIKIK